MKWTAKKTEVVSAVDRLSEMMKAPNVDMLKISEEIGNLKSLAEHLPEQDEARII